MSRDQRGSIDVRRLAQPRAHRHGLPGRFVAQRAEQLAETLDLRRAGENVAQHDKPLVLGGVKVRRYELGTERLPAVANLCPSSI